MKRALVDGWDVDRAVAEATLLGLGDGSLKQFMLAEIQKRKSANR